MREPTPQTRRVIEAVAPCLSATAEMVLSEERHRNTALARMVAAYVLREFRAPQPSWTELGRELGRHAASVKSGHENVVERIQAQDLLIIGAVEAGRKALERSGEDLVGKCRRLKALEAECAELRREIAAMSGVGLGAAE